MNKTIRIVQGGFAAIFGLTIISVIIRGIKENIPIWAEILLIFVSLVSIGGLVILYQKLKAKKLTEKQSDRIFFYYCRFDADNTDHICSYSLL